jgi:hypothetical protein
MNFKTFVLVSLFLVSFVVCGCARKQGLKRQIGFEIGGKVIEPDLLDREEFATKGGTVYSFYLKDGFRVKDGQEIIYNNMHDRDDVTINTYVDGKLISGQTIFDVPE